MDMYPKYKSKFGYQIGNNQIDSYGVDHSGFSLQDELEYQYAREEKENKLLEQLKSRGITQDLPQYGTDFWGDSANNYGFGTTDIAANIEKMQNNPTPIPMAAAVPQQPVQINKSLQNGIQNNISSARNNVKNFAQNAINVIAPYTPYNIGQKIGELAADTKIAYDYWKKMNQTGKQIVKTFGSGQGANIEKMNNSILLDNPVTQQKNFSIEYSLYGTDFSKEFIDNMLKDRDYQKALQEYAIPNEGGYINNINDPGGETNMGISKRYHPDEDIKNMTRERANALLYNEVWNWNGINKLPREVRGFVFDHGIRTSPQNAIETTHKALGINPVGDVIGDTTLYRLQQSNYEDFLHKYQNLVREQDRNNPKYDYFGKGWDRRTNAYHVSY